MVTFFLFAMAGCFGEVLWTTGYEVVEGLFRRKIDWRLRGHTYGWMILIYGFGGFLFIELHASIADLHWGLRGMVYMAVAMVVEYIAGWVIKRLTGVIPWDYTGTRWHLHGLVRWDYIPVWFAVGLMTEQIEWAISIMVPVFENL